VPKVKHINNKKVHLPRFRSHALPEELEWTWNCLEWVPFKASLQKIIDKMYN
jgi:hypothetical protein